MLLESAFSSPQRYSTAFGISRTKVVEVSSSTLSGNAALDFWQYTRILWQKAMCLHQVSGHMHVS